MNKFQLYLLPQQVETWSYPNNGLNKTALVENLKVLLLCWSQTQPAPQAPSTVVMILSHTPDPDLHASLLAFHLGRIRQAVALNSCQKDCTKNLVGIVKKYLFSQSSPLSTLFNWSLDWQWYFEMHIWKTILMIITVYFHLQSVESHDFSMLCGILAYGLFSPSASIQFHSLHKNFHSRCFTFRNHSVLKT